MPRKKPGPNRYNTDINHLLANKEKIYKYLCKGMSMDNIAKKLGVSRSWLFDQFNKYEWLDELRKSAKAERWEHIHNTMYQLAIGDYRTYAKHTTKTTATDNEGVTSTNTVVEENTIEHRKDPNLRALGIYMRSENLLPKENDTRIVDSLDDGEYIYVDVAEDGSDEGH